MTIDDKTKGWGGVVGPFHGGMTIQGLLPWYYEEVHPGMAVELNRCVYNNMADNPTTEKSLKNGTLQGRCRTNEEVCCRGVTAGCKHFDVSIPLDSNNCLSSEISEMRGLPDSSFGRNSHVSLHCLSKTMALFTAKIGCNRKAIMS